MVIMFEKLKSNLFIWREYHLRRPFEAFALKDRTNLVGAEIGVYEGRHAAKLAAGGTVTTLFCIDPYLAYSDHNKQDLARAKRAASHRLSRYPTVRFIYSDSVTSARLVPQLDFAYLDGNHAYTDVKTDIETWWPKIKQGGILGGHDFVEADPGYPCDVIQAVTEFTVANTLHLSVRRMDWWVIKP